MPEIENPESKQAPLLRTSQRQGDATPGDAKSAEGRGFGSRFRAFCRPDRSQVIFAVILFITGLLVASAVRARDASPDFSTMRRADLIEMLDTLTSDSRNLEREIGELQRTRERLESGADAAQLAAEQARRRLESMQILAGTAPAAGPGVRITIFDPNKKIGPEIVLGAINELRDAGAEVIQINEKVRVVASTWVGQSASGDLIVDSQAVSFPLTIDAIGEPATLEAGARFRGGLVSEVNNEQVGGTVAITQLDRLEITAKASIKPPQFAKPHS